MLKYLLISVILISFVGCSSISVSTDYDPATDFNGYKSFAVYKDEVKGSELEKAPLIKSRIIDAIERTMVQKGFSKESLDNANIIVYPFAGTKDKINVTDWGYGYGGGYWRGYPYGRNIDVSEYTEASIVLDFVDGKSKELVWRGIGTGVLQQNRTPEERTQAIDEAIKSILENYPPVKN